MRFLAAALNPYRFVKLLTDLSLGVLPTPPGLRDLAEVPFTFASVLWEEM